MPLGEDEFATLNSPKEERFRDVPWGDIMDARRDPKPINKTSGKQVKVIEKYVSRVDSLLTIAPRNYQTAQQRTRYLSSPFQSHDSSKPVEQIVKDMNAAHISPSSPKDMESGFEVNSPNFWNRSPSLDSMDYHMQSEIDHMAPKDKAVLGNSWEEESRNSSFKKGSFISYIFSSRRRNDESTSKVSITHN
jgi:hypothetical protein